MVMADSRAQQKRRLDGRGCSGWEQDAEEVVAAQKLMRVTEGDKGLQRAEDSCTGTQ